MSSKGYIRIEQKGDLYSLIRLAETTPVPLEPEEHALQRSLLDRYECFDFDDVTQQLKDAVRAFRWALQDTSYFSERLVLFAPAWILSAIGILLTLMQAPIPRNSGRLLALDLAATFGSFLVGLRTLRGPFDKIISRLPGSVAPKRPWTGADNRPFTFFAISAVGIAVLSFLSNAVVAIVVACYLVVNAIFLGALSGPTAAGKEMAAQLAEYKKFLSEVEADPISRMNSAEQTPEQLRQREAYAIAFHLDLGWGEQFVTAISDLIESADILEIFKRGGDPLR
jgi:hypothetical protein